MLLKCFNCVVGFVSNWLFSIFVVMLVVGAYFLFFDFLTSEIPIKKLPAAVREGTFGDSFGTLNAFFFWLGFFGCSVDIVLAKKRSF